VLLVDDNEPQLRQRGQHRQPGAQHDAGVSQVGGEPVEHPFALGQPAVQRRHHQPRKAGADIVFQLRRQVDFRDQDQHLRLRLAREDLRSGLQVDLGLAAASHAIQQHGREADGVGHRIGRLALRRVQRRHPCRRRIRRRPVLRDLLQRPVQRHRVFGAQIPGHARHRHFAQGPLVVVGREAAQRNPVPGQRRELGTHRQRRLQFFRRQVAGGGDIHNQAGDLPPAERHHRKLADLWLRSTFFHCPSVVEQEVKRGIECNFEYPDWSHLRRILKI
jgi:hypothetical protein